MAAKPHGRLLYTEINGVLRYTVLYTLKENVVCPAPQVTDYDVQYVICLNRIGNSDSEIGPGLLKDLTGILIPVLCLLNKSIISQPDAGDILIRFLDASFGTVHLQTVSESAVTDPSLGPYPRMSDIAGIPESSLIYLTVNDRCHTYTGTMKDIKHIFILGFDLHMPEKMCIIPHINGKIKDFAQFFCDIKIFPSPYTADLLGNILLKVHDTRKPDPHTDDLITAYARFYKRFAHMLCYRIPDLPAVRIFRNFPLSGIDNRSIQSGDRHVDRCNVNINPDCIVNIPA